MGRPCFLTHRLKATIANQVLDLCALGAQKLAVLQPRLVDLELLVGRSLKLSSSVTHAPLRMFESFGTDYSSRCFFSFFSRLWNPGPAVNSQRKGKNYIQNHAGRDRDCTTKTMNMQAAKLKQIRGK